MSRPRSTVQSASLPGLDDLQCLPGSIMIEFIRQNPKPTSSLVPRDAVPRARKLATTDGADTTETKPVQGPVADSSMHQSTSNPKPKGKKPKEKERKVVLAKNDIVEWAGGEAAYKRTMTDLRKAGLWSGSFDSRKNLRVVRLFTRIRADKSDHKVSDVDTYVQITFEDFAWWIRHGPDLGKKITWNKESSGPNGSVGYARAQLEHFVDGVVDDRYSKQSLRTYEGLAEANGGKAWSGDVVGMIVEKAWEIQRLESSDVAEQVDSVLEHSAILQARRMLLEEGDPASVGVSDHKGHAGTSASTSKRKTLDSSQKGPAKKKRKTIPPKYKA